jgi:hypothetical protein
MENIGDFMTNLEDLVSAELETLGSFITEK